MPSRSSCAGPRSAAPCSASGAFMAGFRTLGADQARDLRDRVQVLRIDLVGLERDPVVLLDEQHELQRRDRIEQAARDEPRRDRKSTRLNSSHLGISYAVFCLKKKK